MKTNYYFITNKCNCSCPYCFVSHSDYVMSDDEISRIEPEVGEKNIIYGGEPTLYPDVVMKVLSKLRYSNIRLYSNGYDTDFLRTLKNIKICINLDAYYYLQQKSLDKIIQYDWNFTIAPSNLDKVLDVYDLFVRYDKFADMKVMRYDTKTPWSEDDIEKLEDVISQLYQKYAVEKRMPAVLKNSLNSLVLIATEKQEQNDCTEMHYSDVNSCNTEKVPNTICTSCDYRFGCQFNRPCLQTNQNYKSLCAVEHVLLRQASKITEILKDDNMFQRSLMTICKTNYTGG